MNRGPILRITWVFVVLCFVGGIGVAEEGAEERGSGRGEGHAWLGVWLSDAVDGGAQVNAVVGDGPADVAGLKSGDVVFEAGGRPIGDEDGLGRVLRKMTPGEALALKVWRAGRPVELSAVLSSRHPRQRVPQPPSPPAPSRAPRLVSGDPGLTVSEITPGLREHFGAPEDTGILVTRVAPGRAAAEAGVQVGDVLVRVGGAEIRTERDLRVNLVRWNHRDPIVVEVVRGREPTELTVTAPKVAPAPAGISGQEVRVRRLEIEIESLRRRLVELERELERTLEED